MKTKIDKINMPVTGILELNRLIAIAFIGFAMIWINPIPWLFLEIFTGNSLIDFIPDEDKLYFTSQACLGIVMYLSAIIIARDINNSHHRVNFTEGWITNEKTWDRIGILEKVGTYLMVIGCILYLVPLLSWINSDFYIMIVIVFAIAGNIYLLTWAIPWSWSKIANDKLISLYEERYRKLMDELELTLQNDWGISPSNFEANYSFNILTFSPKMSVLEDRQKRIEHLEAVQGLIKTVPADGNHQEYCRLGVAIGAALTQNDAENFPIIKDNMKELINKIIFKQSAEVLIKIEEGYRKASPAVTQT